MGSTYVSQAGLGSRDPSASASKLAGTISLCHHAESLQETKATLKRECGIKIKGIGTSNFFKSSAHICEWACIDVGI